jgi:hypothetical protein
MSQIGEIVNKTKRVASACVLAILLASGVQLSAANAADQARSASTALVAPFHETYVLPSDQMYKVVYRRFLQPGERVLSFGRDGAFLVVDSVKKPRYLESKPYDVKTMGYPIGPWKRFAPKV